ncbi:hypothetical protein [Streptomyces sp. NPDC049040]|uniref:hypothetical protein n=1 Tax=Streptomyces sp. NPDC049040 TaxID=3365593 RepID=UPI00371FCD75
MGAALFGAAVEYTAWNVSARARAYCDAGYDAGGAFEIAFLLPVMVGIGVFLGATTCAAALHLTRRAPAPVRACAAVLLVVLTTVSLGWWLFASRGTLDGYPGDSGLCPASNIPPWWPAWIPA